MADKHLECPICLDIFLSPRSLPCGHSLCKDCIPGLVKGITLTCPADTQQYIVPPEGFPKNYGLSDVIDKKVCCGCHKGVPKKMCPHCSVRLCHLCVKRHKLYMGITEELAALKQEHSDTDSIVKRTEADQQDHLDEIEALEKRMVKLVKDHIKEMKDEAESTYKKKRSWCTETRRQLKHSLVYIKSTSRSLGDDPNNDDITKDVCDKIKSECQDMTGHLQRQVSSKPERTASLECDLPSLKTAIEASTRVVRTDARATGAQLPGGDAGRAGGAGRASINPVVVVKAIRPRVIGGRGNTPGKFDQPCDASVNPITSQVLVADRGNWRVQVLDGVTFSHVKYITRTNWFKSLSAPRCIHSTVQGDILVSTTIGNVAMFDQTGKYTKLLDGPWQSPRDIVSDASRIYICDSRARIIRVFSLNGEHIRDISKPHILTSDPWHIAVCDDMIIVSCCRTLYYLSKQGDLLKTLGTVAESDITGLAADNQGNLFISCSNHPISVVRDKAVVQRVGECGRDSWKLNKPSGLALTRNGQLIVANRSHHNLLVYDLSGR